MHPLQSLMSASSHQRGFSHFITGGRRGFSLVNSSFTALPSPDAKSVSANRHRYKWSIWKGKSGTIVLHQYPWFWEHFWNTSDDIPCRSLLAYLQSFSCTISAQLWHKPRVVFNNLSIRQVIWLQFPLLTGTLQCDFGPSSTSSTATVLTKHPWSLWRAAGGTGVS